MKHFRVEAVAQTEFEEAAGWYEAQREGLGLEFIAELDRVLVRIAHEEKFATAPIVASSSTGSRTWSCLSRRMTSAG